MKKEHIIAVVLLVLVVGVFGFMQYKKMHDNSYSVVYLTSGEVYVGKLSMFPNMELKDGYVLQVTKDPSDATKTNFQLNPINEALWAPSSLHLIEKNVIFYGALSPTSTIAKKLAEQKK